MAQYFSFLHVNKRFYGFANSIDSKKQLIGLNRKSNYVVIASYIP